MRLLEIRLHRFGSFLEDVTFRFPEGHGLFMLKGENGAGKSTLWNAICWCLYDRTVRGLRAGDVANWGDPKGARVELDVKIEDWTCTVIRQHAPNKWLFCHDSLDEFLDLTKHPDNPFLSALRLQVEPFLNCVLMGQGRPMFLDLPATKKAELFSDVLRLDVWLERAALAGRKAKDQDAITRDLERRLAALDGELRGIDHSALEGSASEWKAEHERRLERLHERYNAMLVERKKLKATIAIDDQDLSKARQSLKAGVKVVETQEQVVASAFKACRAADDDVAELTDKIIKLEAQRDRLASMSECPTCLQHVPHQHSTKITDGLTRDRARLVALRSQHTERADAEAEDLSALQLELAEAQRVVSRWHESVQQYDKDLRKIENDIAYLDRDLDRLEDEAQELDRERNPFASMRKEALDREEGLQAQRRHVQRLLDDSEGRYYLLNFWATKGFKELRLQAIHESLQEFEIEANGSLEELGLHGWELRFDVDKESKKGSVQAGFSVQVLSPHNDRAVPWESWSGGESQRLRLAAQQGLADLIRARSGADLDLEVWDEPTQHLNAQGVQDLLDSLAARAQREKRQIWIVDHRSLGYGSFEDVYTVVKTPNGSTIEH